LSLSGCFQWQKLKRHKASKRREASDGTRTMRSLSTYVNRPHIEESLTFALVGGCNGTRTGSCGNTRKAACTRTCTCTYVCHTRARAHTHTQTHMHTRTHTQSKVIEQLQRFELGWLRGQEASSNASSNSSASKWARAHVPLRKATRQRRAKRPPASLPVILHTHSDEHIELPAKLLDSFLRSNKCNINPPEHALASSRGCGVLARKDSGDKG